MSAATPIREWQQQKAGTLRQQAKAAGKAKDKTGSSSAKSKADKSSGSKQAGNDKSKDKAGKKSASKKAQKQQQQGSSAHPDNSAAASQTPVKGTQPAAQNGMDVTSDAKSGAAQLLPPGSLSAAPAGNTPARPAQQQQEPAQSAVALHQPQLVPMQV